MLLFFCACVVTCVLAHFLNHGAFDDSTTRRLGAPEPSSGDGVNNLTPAPPQSLELDRSRDASRVGDSEAQATLSISVHEMNGGPIGGCSVSTGATTAATDSEGHATMIVPPGRIHLEFHPSERSLFEPLKGAIRLSAGETKHLDVVLSRREGFQFCVQVLSAADGRPLANAQVRVLGEKANVFTDVLGRACVGAHGSDTAVEAGLDGFAAKIVAAEPGHEAPSSALQVRLEEGANLAVRVVDERGLCIPDADVDVRVNGSDQTFPRYAPVCVRRDTRQEHVSGDEGAQFVELPPGAEVNVKAMLAKDWLGSTEQRVVLRDRSTLLTMTVRPFRCIRGRVVDESGAAVAGVVARAERLRSADVPRMVDGPRDECWGDSAPTDSSGRFVIPHVGPGLWDVGSIGLGGVLTTVQRVEVSLEADAWVDLKIVPAEESITGVVVGDRVVPCPDLWVYAYADGVQMASDRTDAEGRFQLEGLPSGEYEVEGWGIPSLRARTGAPSLTIKRPVETNITGKLPGGLWWISAGGEGTVEGESDLDGGFSLGPVPSGSWFDLYIRNGDGRVAMIRVQASSRVEPLVVDPKPGAWLYLSDPVADSALVTSRGVQVVFRMEQGSTASALVPVGKVTIEFRCERGPVLANVTTSLEPGERVLVTRAGRVAQVGSRVVR